MFLCFVRLLWKQKHRHLVFLVPIKPFFNGGGAGQVDQLRQLRRFVVSFVSSKFSETADEAAIGRHV